MISMDELRGCPFFEGFSEAELAALSEIAVVSHWKEGESLFETGDQAQALHILRSGSVLLSYPTGRSLFLHMRGQAIGWSSLYTPYRHTATAMCLTEVATCQYPAAELYELILMNSDFGYRLMQNISQLRQDLRPYWGEKRAKANGQ